jgi:hypothetical protein
MSRLSRIPWFIFCCALGGVHCASRSNGPDNLPMPPPAEEPPIAEAATTGPDAGAAALRTDPSGEDI